MSRVLPHSVTVARTDKIDKKKLGNAGSDSKMLQHLLDFFFSII